MSDHRCHAHGCTSRVPPRMMMCLGHWTMLRPALRRAIWREYRPGQENDKNPSPRYLAVQQRAIGEVAFRPHDEKAARDAAPYLLRSQAWRTYCVEHGLGDPLEGELRSTARLPEKEKP